MALPLTPGQHGPEIRDLRRRLGRWLDDNDADIELSEDEVYDEVTEQAVRHFQRARNLPADAVVGPETWTALVEANYALGDRLLWQSRTVMRGDDILDLQQRLNRLGFDAGIEDGLFESSTRRAVMDFQANAGLEVDGIVGADTLQTLQRLHRGHQVSGVGTHVREAEAVRRVARRGLVGLQVMVDAVDLPPGLREDDTGGDISWQIATRLAGRLGAAGSTAVLSRGHRTHPAASERAGLANRLGVDLVVSIGLNTSDTPAAAGCAAYYFGSLRFVSAAGQALADALLDAALAAGLGPDCRPHPMTWTLLRETRMPAVVLEPAFATNPADLARLREAQRQDILSANLLKGIQRFLDDYDA